jgi:MFS family permease
VALLPPLRRHPLSALGVATACSGPPLAVIGLVTAPVVAGVLAAAFGAAGATVYACGQTLLQRRLPDEVLARGFAALQMVGMGGLALGTALTPVLIAAAGLKVTLAVTGALAPVSLLAFAAGGRSRRPTGEARRTSSPRPRPPG